MDRELALVTGAGTGFGLLTAIELARRGFHVIATMRDVSKRDGLDKAAAQAGVAARLEVERLDVTDDAQVAEVAARIHARAPGLGVLVNNAGFGLSGFAEDVALDELKRQFETNFFGAVRTTLAFLPKMRERGHGRIVNVSSGWGRIGPPFSSAYASSKWALEGWSESLHFEVRRFGVRVIVVEPGAFRTEIWNKRVFAKRALDAASFYRDKTTKLEERTSEYLKTLKADPAKVARAIGDAATASNPALRYTVGLDVKFGIFLRWLLPARTFEWTFEKVMDWKLG